MKPDDPEQDSGLLYVPEGFRQPPTTGVIVDVGDEVEEDAISEGVRVLYSIYAGTYLEVEGEKRLIMDASQAMAVVGEDEKVTATVGGS